MQLDLASLASVRGFIDNSRAGALPPIQAVICNAGVQVVSGVQSTADGHEMTFGVNHLGHFALVCGLLDTLHAARIVVVSSGTHDPARFTGMPHSRYTSGAALARPPGDLTAEEGRRRYTTSKLCNLLFCYELDRRLDHGAQGMTVNAFDPGLMPGSGLGRDYSHYSGSPGITYYLLCAFCPVSTAPALAGATSPLWRRTRATTV